MNHHELISRPRPRRALRRSPARRRIFCIAISLLAFWLGIRSSPAAAGETCGYFQPVVEVVTDPETGERAVNVEGPWPVMIDDARIEVAPFPNAEGEILLTIAGPIAGLLVIGHYDESVPLPPLSPGTYRLVVELHFELAGVEDDVRQCGSFPFFIPAEIPALSTLGAGILALVIAALGGVLMRRSRPRDSGALR